MPKHFSDIGVSAVLGDCPPSPGLIAGLEVVELHDRRKRDRKRERERARARESEHESEREKERFGTRRLEGSQRGVGLRHTHRPQSSSFWDSLIEF